MRASAGDTGQGIASADGIRVEIHFLTLDPETDQACG